MFRLELLPSPRVRTHGLNDGESVTPVEFQKSSAQVLARRNTDAGGTFQELNERHRGSLGHRCQWERDNLACIVISDVFAMAVMMINRTIGAHHSIEQLDRPLCFLGKNHIEAIAMRNDRYSDNRKG